VTIAVSLGVRTRPSCNFMSIEERSTISTVFTIASWNSGCSQPAYSYTKME
jgi:hypothetical protein